MGNETFVGDNIIFVAFIIAVIGLPFVLTLWNIITFIIYAKSKRDRLIHRIIEPVAVAIGVFYTFAYISFRDVMMKADWYEQLYNNQVHSMLNTEMLPTLIVFMALSAVGYLIMRYIPARKLSPIVAVFAIAAMYIGSVILIIWCIHVVNFFMILAPLNIILIFAKTIMIFVIKKNNYIQSGESPIRLTKLSAFLNKTVNLPWIALIAVVPLMGIVILILVLFGQAPDSIIKVWTETADWTFSSKIPPQNIEYDEHYLCTVAAGGHKKVVRPLRTGMRHGHRVIVNRQLCVANAFEQVLEEKTPRFHRVVRKIYDSTGYPISKHIHSKYVADIIYFIMKPLEWLFLLVLYTVDVKPENRIAVQYPHKPLPKASER